jgi:hypothetical protein
MQRPLEHIRGEVIGRGENLAAGADTQVRIDEFGRTPGGGADVVEVKLEQCWILVRGGQPDGERVERIVATRRSFGNLPVGHVVSGRLGIGGCHESDQNVLGIDDQVTHQVSHEPAGTARWPGEVCVAEFGDRRAQCRPRE